MSDKIQILINTKIAPGQQATLQNQLNAISKNLVLNIGKININPQQMQQQATQAGTKAGQAAGTAMAKGINNIGARTRVTLFDDVAKSFNQSQIEGKLTSLRGKFEAISKGKMFDPSQVSAMRAQMDQLATSSGKVTNSKMLQQWNTDFNKLNMQFGQMNRQFQEGERNSLKLGEAFKQAFSKFPKHSHIRAYGA